MDLIAALKVATADAHKAVEELVPLMKKDVTIVDYEAYLRAFFGLLEPLEVQLAHVPHLLEALPDYRLRRKSELLRDDLRRLGMRDWEIDDLPRCQQLPTLTTMPQAMGCLYVLEGSTLGGHVLRSHLRFHLGGTFEVASSFLSAYGPNLTAMWRSFGKHLVHAIHTEADRLALVASAQDTFAAFHVWFEHCSHSWSSLS
jgi:heme oxygenase (biliverdin-IX-beta and delta-forming)